MIDAALAYARHGWRVFPIDPSSKIPATERGHLDATDDAGQVRAWWARLPDARIGLHLRASGLVAIDVDVRDKGDGRATLAALEQRLGPLPRGMVQITPSGGLHIVMRDPAPGPDGWTRPADEGGRVRARPAPLIDFKVNGYIVLAPSGRYRWESGAWLEFGLVGSVPEMPEAWRTFLQHPEAARLDGGVESWDESIGPWSEAAAERLRARLAPIKRQRGTADPTLVAARAIFHDAGRSVEDGLPFFQEWSDAQPPGGSYSAHELSRQLRRCARYAAAWAEDRPRGWALRDVYEQAALMELAGRA